jgi:hypothetical protein
VPDPITNEITLTVTAAIDGFKPLDVSAVVTLEPVAPEPPDPGPGPDPGPDPAPGDLSVCIDYGGAQVWFHADGATDRGDWTDARGGFVQNRLDVTNTELPAFLVQFRCDREGGRTEVVFELGDTTVGTAAFNMGAYTATIYRGEDVLATVPVPEHYWYSRWRWQSVPRPIVATIEELQDAGLLPSFDLALSQTRPLSAQRVYTPMKLAGLTAYMPGTGERDEIGLVTEAQAEFLRGDASVDSLIAQAEASGTFPWHYRDEDGVAVFNFVTHPQASMYYPANLPAIGTPVTLDVAHEPDLCYVPYLLTGDPYYLEELQFAATYNVLASNPQSRGSYCIGFATRAHAWALRTLAHCARVTPDDAPAWVQSRAYWQEWLDGNRDWMLTRYVHPTALPFTEVPYASPLHYMADATNSPATSTMPAGTCSQQWMEDYEAAVLGHVVQIGFVDWMPILEWKLVNSIARTNGTSGWIRAKPTPYNVALRATDKSPYAQSWQELWDLNVTMQPAIGIYEDPDTMPAGDSLVYASYTMSALALAASVGVEGAADCHEWLRGQLVANSDGETYSDRKWSFGSGYGR